MLVIVVIPLDMDWCDEGQIIPCCEFSQYEMGVILWVCGSVISFSVLKFHILMFISSLCLFPTIFTPYQCSISKTPLVYLSPCLSLDLRQFICIMRLLFLFSSCVPVSPCLIFLIFVSSFWFLIHSSCFRFVLLFSWNCFWFVLCLLLVLGFSLICFLSFVATILDFGFIALGLCLYVSEAHLLLSYLPACVSACGSPIFNCDKGTLYVKEYLQYARLCSCHECPLDAFILRTQMDPKALW